RRYSSDSPDVVASPGSDASVVAGEQDFRHLPAPELGGSRVVRVLDATVEGRREAFDLARAVRECSGKAPRDRVDHSERRDLAPGKDVGADGDSVRAEMIDDPLVEALEACGEERHSGL